MAVAFCVKAFLLYSACYRGICPERRAGLWLVLGMSIVVIVMALLPDLAVKEEKPDA